MRESLAGATSNEQNYLDLGYSESVVETRVAEWMAPVVLSAAPPVIRAAAAAAKAYSLANKWGFFGRQSAPEKVVNDIAVRRAYLNEKFGRVGDLDTDIILRGYLRQAESLDVSTSPNTAVFYSGDFQANRIRAEVFARETNRFTLEMTPGGSYLDNQHIFNLFSERPDLAVSVWSKLSARFAQQASGEVNAFVYNSHIKSIFNSIELPILKNNSNIENIIYRRDPWIVEDFELEINRQLNFRR